jgi:hypothetical protein
VQGSNSNLVEERKRKKEGKKEKRKEGSKEGRDGRRKEI